MPTPITGASVLASNINIRGLTTTTQPRSHNLCRCHPPGWSRHIQDRHCRLLRRSVYYFSMEFYSLHQLFRPPCCSHLAHAKCMYAPHQVLARTD